jgi:hypothetical protein
MQPFAWKSYSEKLDRLPEFGAAGGPRPTKLTLDGLRSHATVRSARGDGTACDNLDRLGPSWLSTGVELTPPCLDWTLEKQTDGRPLQKLDQAK